MELDSIYLSGNISRKLYLFSTTFLSIPVPLTVSSLVQFQSGNVKCQLDSVFYQQKKLDSVAHFGVQQVVLNPVPQSLFKTGLSSNGQ